MIKVAIDYDPSIRGTRIWIVDEKEDGEYIYEHTHLSVKKVESNAEMLPTFVFNRRDGHQFLQELSNALAKSGYKPDEIKAADRQVEAIKFHLEDMRKLVFKHEGI